jgi:hypothetical protein
LVSIINNVFFWAKPISLIAIAGTHSTTPVTNLKNILTIIKICINLLDIFFVMVIKTMSDIARIQNLAISILPLLLGLALLRLLLKAFSPSFLGRH